VSECDREASVMRLGSFAPKKKRRWEGNIKDLQRKSSKLLVLLHWPRTWSIVSRV
jgi:hypothetical protein